MKQTNSESITSVLTDWRSRAMISIPEASLITGLGRATICRLLAAGTLPSVKIGKRRGIRPEALEAMLKAGEVTSIPIGGNG